MLTALTPSAVHCCLTHPSHCITPFLRMWGTQPCSELQPQAHTQMSEDISLQGNSVIKLSPTVLPHPALFHLSLRVLSCN